MVHVSKYGKMDYIHVFLSANELKVCETIELMNLLDFDGFFVSQLKPHLKLYYRSSYSFRTRPDQRTAYGPEQCIA
ncbi:unnamed protein product, partial [Allacma fusca]